MGYDPWPKTQSSTVAGRSGRTNSTFSQNSKIRRALPPRLGIISAVLLKGGSQPIPFVKVRWVHNPDQESGWIPLEDHPMAIAHLYAAKLEDLVGQYTVKVYYNDANSSSGVGRIVGNTIADPEQVDPQIESSGVKII